MLNTTCVAGHTCPAIRVRLTMGDPSEWLVFLRFLVKSFLSLCFQSLLKKIVVVTTPVF